jgi:phosphoglycerate dehydrogenase-like enzyme
LTPHIGYVTHGSYQVFYRDVVDDIVAFLAGHPVRVLNENRGTT